MRPTIAALLLATCLGSYAWSEDEAPRPVPARAVQEMWTYEREGIAQRLDVTKLSPPVRAAVHAQLEADGWRRTGRERVPLDPKGAATAALSAGMRGDLEALVRGGGRLPDGYVPRGLGRGARAETPAATPPRQDPPSGRALARLVLAYLAAQGDERRTPVLERALRVLAEDLLRAPPASASPPAEPASGLPRDLGGARLRLRREPGGASAPGADVLAVPADSTAWAASLRAGDRILALEGRPVDPAGLRRAARVFVHGGQLVLRVLRRDGRIEVLELEFEVGDDDVETDR